MNRRLLWVGGGVAGLGLIVWLAFTIAAEPTVDVEAAFGNVTVVGAPFSPLLDPAQEDPAIGVTAPTVSGIDWNGKQSTIGPDGRAKIIVFLAHWCPHCQVEVPRIVSWLDGGGVPDSVDIYSVTVGTDPLRPNFPPKEWLETEGWSVPVIMDDEIGSAATAYGLTGTPFYVVLDGENRNLGRFSGEIGLAGLEALVSLAQGGLEG